MNINDLTNLLVTSSERANQSRFIPWWEADHEELIYRYDMLEDQTIQDAESCLAECGKEQLLAPVGKAGLTLFHLLVWHNFHDPVEKMLCDGRIGAGDIDTPDHKGHGLTPFLLACDRGNLSMARLLLDHGADDSLCDERGMNAYHFLAYPRFENEIPAINFNCLENSVEQRGAIARLLTCDINRKSRAGLTPLELLLSTSYSANYTWPLTGIFLEKDASTGYVDEDGNTLLMMAMRNGHRTAALQLMKACPEMVNIADKKGMTPIQYAVNFYNQAMYLALKDHGADPAPGMELPPLSQITSNLFADVQRDNMDGLSIALYMTEKLIRQVDPDDDDELGQITDILHNALVSDEKAHVLDTCGEAGIDFTMPIHYRGQVFCLRDKCLQPGYGIGVIRKLKELDVDMDQAVVKGHTPANILASTGSGKADFYGEAAKLFSKESMEQLDNDGEAALHLAVENGHTGMLKVMIEKGVDINLTKDEPAEAGVTPLHLACAHGHTDAVKLLIAAGADDTMKNVKGETPAHFALLEKKHGRALTPEQKAEILKELKSLDIPREDGKTPLLLLTCRDGASLSLLLDRGVDVNHKDNEGMTSLMLCMDKDMAKELLRAGAEINMADNQGNTILHHALKHGSEALARYLIKKGADYNHPDNHGVTPAQIAVEKGFESVLELMTDIK